MLICSKRHARMNKTSQDAYKRVAYAKLDSLDGNPSEEYLVVLRNQLYEWIEEIDQNLLKMQSDD